MPIEGGTRPPLSCRLEDYQKIDASSVFTPPPPAPPADLHVCIVIRKVHFAVRQLVDHAAFANACVSPCTDFASMLETTEAAGAAGDGGEREYAGSSLWSVLR